LRRQEGYGKVTGSKVRHLEEKKEPFRKKKRGGDGLDGGGERRKLLSVSRRRKISITSSRDLGRIGAGGKRRRGAKTAA